MMAAKAPVERVSVVPPKRFRPAKFARRLWWRARRHARVLALISVPAVAGALLSANVDMTAPPLGGKELVTAVFLLDGQAYIGHLEDVAWSETLVLHDVYYFQDARGTTTNLPLALVKRGGEVHAPADGVRVRRDKVLAVERVGLDSAVGRAIAAQRAIEKKVIQ